MNPMEKNIYLTRVHDNETGNELIAFDITFHSRNLVIQWNVFLFFLVAVVTYVIIYG